MGFGLGTARLAMVRRRSVPLWAVFGAILGPIALALVWLAPPGRCAFCDSPTLGWLTTCAWCGNDVRGAAEVLAVDEASVAGTPAAAAAGAAGAAAVTTAAGDPRPAPPSVAAPAPGSVSVTATASGPDRATTRAAAARAPRTAATDLGHRPGVVPEAEAGAPVASGARGTTRSAGRKAADSDRNGAAPARTAGATAVMTAPPTRVLASAIFITGSVGLIPGARYTIEVAGDRFRVLGPVDQDPGRLALDRPIRVMDATAFEGRLVVNERGPGSGGAVLAFMSLSGSPAAAVATTIVELAGGDGA